MQEDDIELPLGEWNDDIFIHYQTNVNSDLSTFESALILRKVNLDHETTHH